MFNCYVQIICNYAVIAAWMNDRIRIKFRTESFFGMLRKVYYGRVSPESWATRLVFRATLTFICYYIQLAALVTKEAFPALSTFLKTMTTSETIPTRILLIFSVFQQVNFPIAIIESGIITVIYLLSIWSFVCFIKTFFLLWFRPKKLVLFLLFPNRTVIYQYDKHIRQYYDLHEMRWSYQFGMLGTGLASIRWAWICGVHGDKVVISIWDARLRRGFIYHLL